MEITVRSIIDASKYMLQTIAFLFLVSVPVPSRFPADAGFAWGRVKHCFIQCVGQNSNPAAIYPDFRWCGMCGALIKTTNWRL